MVLPAFKKFIKLMKDELSNSNKPRNNRFHWAINESKYLDLERVKRLRTVCLQAKNKALKGNKVIPVRNWFMVEMGLFTGLRVKEIANLTVSDLYIDENRSSLIVKQGKGNKPRVVFLPEAFKKECFFYLDWKQKSLPPSDYLFTNSKGRQLTKRALQKAFKGRIGLAGIETHYSIHCLRHTYGSFLYRSSGHNLRLVQEQLGHSNIKTTQVYASLMNDEVKRAVEKLYQDSSKTN